MQPKLSIQHVGKSFGGVRALDDVSFDIRPGELHAIMGENGAGKSTLMKILSGVINDYEGSVLVNGQAARFQGTRDAENAGISIIHQELNLVEELTVAANIFLGRECHRWGVLQQREMDRQARQLLEQLQCPLAPDALVSTLRVGDQQLVEIAKALSLQASVLIMDEPTSALTETEVTRLYRVIDHLRAQQVTILYISHKMEEVFRLADRITVLRDGRFVQTIDKIATSPQQIAHAMVGREIEQLEAGHRRHEQEVVLEVRDLQLPWPGHAARYRLQGISFELHRGEILGIAGLMGAGRTELLECLYGASELEPEGTILLSGQRVSFRHPSEAMRAGIAMVTEDRKRLGLFGHQAVRHNIVVSALRDFARGGVISGTGERQAATDQVSSLQIKTAGTEASIQSLSGGNQQKCIIGRCILLQPKVLLLDDPTRGVDVGAKAELYRLMHRLANEGMSIIVTSSELPELLQLSDRILALHEGRITAEFDRQTASERSVIEAITNAAAANH